MGIYDIAQQQASERLDPTGLNTVGSGRSATLNGVSRRATQSTRNVAGDLYDLSPVSVTMTTESMLRLILLGVLAADLMLFIIMLGVL